MKRKTIHGTRSTGIRMRSDLESIKIEIRKVQKNENRYYNKVLFFLKINTLLLLKTRICISER